MKCISVYANLNHAEEEKKETKIHCLIANRDFSPFIFYFAVETNDYW